MSPLPTPSTLAPAGLSNPSYVSAILDPAYDSGLFLAESCNTWTEAGFHSPTVSATRLMVPGKASGEYQKACGALKNKKLSEAEDHVRKALGVYPNYAAAWVMLGQILERREKRVDARAACSQAMRVDANYVPPYLCLADFAAKEGDWDQVSVLADRAQSLDPVSNPFTFYFTAYVEFHFLQIREAEKNVEAALQLDTWHHVPELHYLMAQIYEAKGDLRNEAIHLREYLKFAPNAEDAATARTLLAQLDAKSQK
jgi:tetratricopeptide (TPR) repeat protein